MRIAVALLTVMLAGCVSDNATARSDQQTIISSPSVAASPPIEVVVNSNVIEKKPASDAPTEVPILPQETLVSKPNSSDQDIGNEVNLKVAAVKKKKLSNDFTKLPPNASKYLPLLREVANRKWADFHTPSIFAALTEKESCRTLKHSKCWTPYAELKTAREYGFGFGQLTITYDAAGKVRFNKFEEMKKLDSDLRNWEFADRFNAEKQFIALVVLNHLNYKALSKVKTKTETDRVAMMLAAYNGGLGGVTSEIKLCRNTSGCDPERWFGNVETTTRKSKVRPNGYGSSFADINRLYPFDILYTRRDKYLPHFDDSMIHPKLAKAPHKF